MQAQKFQDFYNLFGLSSISDQVFLPYESKFFEKYEDLLKLISFVFGANSESLMTDACRHFLSVMSYFDKAKLCNILESNGV